MGLGFPTLCDDMDKQEEVQRLHVLLLVINLRILTIASPTVTLKRLVLQVVIKHGLQVHRHDPEKMQQVTLRSCPDE